MSIADAMKRREANKQSQTTQFNARAHVREKYRKLAAEELGLDTFEADLKSMGTTIKSIYDGWQTEETMNNTRSSVEAMQKRIALYQEYQKKYGGADLTDVANSYQSILDDWDNRTAVYGQFKNADAYKAEKTRLDLSDKFRVATGRNHETGETTYRGLTFDEVQAKLKEYAPDSDEYKFLSTYTGYTDLNEFNKALEAANAKVEEETAKSKASREKLESSDWYKSAKEVYDNWEIPTVGAWNEKATKEKGVITYYTKKDVEEAQAARDAYMKNALGGKTFEDLQYPKSASLKDAEAYQKELETQKNQWKLDNSFDLYKDVMQNEDFEEKSQYVSTQKESGQWGASVYDEDSDTWYKYEDDLYEFINNKNNAQKNLLENNVGNYKKAQKYQQKGYDQLYPEEVGVYNALYAEDKKNGTNKAQKFLDDMEENLTKRAHDESSAETEETIDNSVFATIGSNIASIPAKIVGAIGGVFASVEEAVTGKEYNPYHHYRKGTNYASDVRRYTSENIEEATEGVDFLGTNLPSFLYNTGMSIADSAASIAIFGGGTSLVMGSSAYQEKAKEMKEAGESEENIFAAALASGLAEVVFEKVSVDRLLKIKNVDSFKRGVVEALKQAGVEGTEETFTEIANILSDNIIRGDNSELAQKYDELKRRGFTEDEINVELAKQVGSQVGLAAIGGMLSGLGMGSGASLKSGLQMSYIGKSIRNNERVSEMLDVAKLTPNESAAYEAYNRYVGKGVDADNITNAQLGNLYATSNTYATDTLNSKKTTMQEKTKAALTKQGLAEVNTENVELKQAKAKENRVAKLTEGNEPTVTSKIEGIKLGKDVKIVTSEGEVSLDGETLSQRDAELVAYAEGIGGEYGEDAANLFLAQDDGQTEVNQYANDFNLAWLKGKNNLTQDSILETKGVLSTEQVTSVYEATVKATFEEQQKVIDTITENQGKTMSIQGTFDDSVIDYNSKTSDGSKVIWNSLTPTQRKAVKFAQLFSKATGVNIRFIKSEVVGGKHKGKNGSYDPDTNTIEIDVYAGRIDAKSLNDAIIPTLSHEITHWAKYKSPAIYNAIREDVMKTLGLKGDLSSDERIATEMARLDKKHPGKKHTPDDALDELVARACEDMLANSKAAKELLAKMSPTEQQTFIDKVKETFENLIKWIDDLLSYYKSNSEEAKILREHKYMLKKISKEWDAMLLSAIEANQALQKEGITGEELAKKVSKAQKNTTKGDVQFDDRSFTEDFKDYEIASAVYEIRHHKAERGKDLVNIGNMPKLYRELFELSGDVYVSNSHLYCCMVSKETAIKEGRYVPDASADYHNLGEEKTINAIEQFQDPMVIMESLNDFNEPRLVSVLYEKGEDKQNLIAVIELYAPLVAYGVKQERNHVLITIYEKSSLPDYIKNTVDAGRVLHIKEGLPFDTLADLQLVGDISKETLKKNIAQFKKKVKKFKEDNKIQYDDRDTDTYSHILEMQTELNKVRQTITEMQNSEEFKAVHDELSKAVENGDVENGIKAYKKWQEKSGYAELSQRRDELQLELENLRKSFTEENTNKALEKEKNAIAKSGLSEADYFRKQAVKEFGYTPYFYDAGYITPNGKMLNFSGEKGQHFGSRGQDHRAIGIIYAETEGTDALNRFVKDGNIRIMPESPGIDISSLVEPTTEQYSTIRKFIYEYANREYFNVELNDENGRVIGSLQYENKINPTRIINDIKHFYATGEIRGQSEIDKFRYADRDENSQTQINQSMTMDEAKQMIQRAFVLGDVLEWYEGEYKNGDEWLRGEGVDEVALHVENEYTLTEKYLNKLQGYIDGDFYVNDILEAYLKGTLTGKEKPKAKRLDTSKDYRVNDKRFYSPQRIKDVKKLLSVASQRVTDKNRAEVSNARAKILLFAHNEGASELLGLTQTELNKKLRTWSGYPAGAIETSKKFNKGVADSNKWTGIENCSWLNRSTVTTEELESLVKEIKGAANDYEKLYIARTMLALDTHIDWSWLSFEFDTNANVNKKHVGSGRCNGFYRNDGRQIVVSHNMPNTVAHEMGHALDYQWGRDLGFSYSALTEVSRNTEQITDAETKQFFDNFRIFIDSLTDNSDIRSEYTQDPKEVFARFVARFIEWVDNTGTGNRSYRVETSYYNDKFSASNYIEFVRLLQEKAMLDAKRMETETSEDVKFSDRDNEGTQLTKAQIEFFKNSKVRDENGNLKVMYHGTENVGFTIFDTGYADDGISLFFTDNLKVAKGYSGTYDTFIPDRKLTVEEMTKELGNSYYYVEENNGKYQIIHNKYGDLEVEYSADSYDEMMRHMRDEWSGVQESGNYKVYLNLTNPLVVDADGNSWDEIEFNGKTSTTREISQYAKDNGYDGVIFNNLYDNAVYATSSERFLESTVAVAFNGNQVKSVANTNPTEDTDIRYADRNNLEISNEDYSKWLSKKAIKVSKETKAKINSQRVTRYANVVEEDIPILDFFRVADYNKVNVAYRYLVRNDGKYNFTIIRKQQIKPQSVPKELNKTIQEAKENARVSTRTGESRNGRYDDSLSVHRVRHGGTVQANDRLATSSKESNEERYNGQGSSNNGRGVKRSDRLEETVYDKTGETRRILKENEKLKADIERLKERLKIERQVTHGNYFNENQLDAVAGHLRKISMSNYSKPELIKLLKDVYSYIAHSEDLNWDDMYAQCCDIARLMLDEAKEETETNDYYKEILDDIRRARFYVNEGQKGDAKYRFGNKWHQVFFGKTHITDNATMSLDQYWKEWADTYPDVFDAGISDASQLVELYDIINAVREASEVVVEYDREEQMRWLAKEIYNQYWNVSTIKTTADKYEKQIKRLNFEHRKAMQEFRTDYEERMAEQKKTERERAKELVAKIRERKDKEIAEAKQRGKEKLAEYKENAERKTKIQSITSNALTLNKWLVKNSKDEHIHEALKGPVIALLQAIDFSSKRMLDKNIPTQKDISLAKALNKVKDMMADATAGKEELVGLYGHDMDEDIAKMVDSMYDITQSFGDNEFVLNKMSLAQLQTLDKLVKTIKQSVTKMNQFHAVNHARGIANLSQESMTYLDSLGKGKVFDGLKGRAKKLLEWSNTLPSYAFKRYGKGGEKVFEAFQDGWDKFAFHVKKIIDYANSVYTSKEVKEWAEVIKTFKILEPATDVERADPNYKPKHQTVQMSVPQIMSLYCLWKREQARGHILGGGIRVADIKTKKDGIISQSKGFLLTYEDISTIIGKLSNRQIEVADKLQEFMNTVCSDWGNEVSMLRFGYKAFGEENYFPIQSDENNLATKDETENSNSLFRLLNMSFAKSLTEGANNRIVISDIFDVFAQHTSDMAKYNALALPVLDAFKWYNYKEKEMKGDTVFKTYSVKQSIETAFGKDGQNYFTTFLEDLNGDKEVSRDTIGGKFFTNAKIAAVGMNLRVVFLQPTSYVRASAVIDNKYLSAAFLHKPKIAKAKKYCGMALWKSMGYYDTDVQRGVAEQIKHSETWKDKATEFSMKGAQKADEITWGYLWNACELEIRRTRKDLKVGSDEFYQAIAKRLREVIYATQVVDSTMTRSQKMRGSGLYDKMLTAFGSEPTIAYNMLQDVYMEMRLDGRTKGKKIAFKNHGKKLARVVTAYTLTNLMAAIVEAGFDAFREDEKEMDLEGFMKLFLTNFANDMSLTAKIPYIKEMHSIIQGFGTSRTDTQWMESMVNAARGWFKILGGEGNPEKVLKHTLKAFSDVSGLAFYNVYRDFMAALNKLGILTTEDIEELFEDLF